MIRLVDLERVTATLPYFPASIHEDELPHLVIRKVSDGHPNVENSFFKLFSSEDCLVPDSPQVFQLFDVIPASDSSDVGVG